MTREQIEDILLDEMGQDYRAEIAEAVHSMDAEVEQWPQNTAIDLARRLVREVIGE